jgi:hypothetical protein
MSQIQQTWALDAFDAVSILASSGQFTITGSDSDQVVLESEDGTFYLQDLFLQINQSWLQIRLPDEHHNASLLILRLPKRKAWVVDLSTWWGKIEVSHLDVRLQASLGEGDLAVIDCRGVLSLSCAKGKVTLDRFTELGVPERPPMPVQTAAPNFGPGMDPKQPGDPWDWSDWGSREWTDWGLRFGEQARNWALQFSQMFGPVDRMNPNAGIYLHISKGDGDLRQISARSCSIFLSKGNLKLEGGQIHDLSLRAAHSNVDCKSILPVGSWGIKTNHGNVLLALPANTQSRIDAAARNGDIRSDAPLVRVPRPGPESGHAVRMVGNIGQSKGDTAQISLAVTHGNIKIELQKDRSSYSYAEPNIRPEAEVPPVDRKMEPEPVTGLQEAAPLQVNPSPSDRPVQNSTPKAQDTQLAILQALSDGAISVDEAEQLLKNL